MAIYHLTAKPVQRSKGHSVVAKMAYRAGEKLKDDRTGKTHDYRKKGKNGVLHTQIITPQGVTAPERNALWNMAEQAEKRKDACLGKEYEFNLPHELDHQDRIAICDEMGEWLADEYSIAVDYAIHAPNKRGDQRNFHCHMMTTTRKITNDGLGEKADLEKAGRKRKDDLKAIRAKFADIVNSHLERKGLAERIDHRSYAEQGIDQTPTRKQGWLATQIEYKADELNEKGIKAERSYIGDINREIKARNSRIDELAKLRTSRLDPMQQAKFNSYFEKSTYGDIVADIQRHAETLATIKDKAETTKLNRQEREQYSYASGFVNAIDDSRLEQKYLAEIAEQHRQQQAQIEAERQAQAELDQVRLDNLADLAELQNSVFTEREQANFDKVLATGDYDSIYQHDFKCRQLIAEIEARLHDDPYTPIDDDDLSQYRYAKAFTHVVDDMTQQQYIDIANYLAERVPSVDISDDELYDIINAPEIEPEPEPTPQPRPEPPQPPQPRPEPRPQPSDRAKLQAKIEEMQNARLQETIERNRELERELERLNQRDQPQSQSQSQSRDEMLLKAKISLQTLKNVIDTMPDGHPSKAKALDSYNQRLQEYERMSDDELRQATSNMPDIVANKAPTIDIKAPTTDHDQDTDKGR